MQVAYVTMYIMIRGKDYVVTTSTAVEFLFSLPPGRPRPLSLRILIFWDRLDNIQ